MKQTSSASAGKKNTYLNVSFLSIASAAALQIPNILYLHDR